MSKTTLLKGLATGIILMSAVTPLEAVATKVTTLGGASTTFIQTPGRMSFITTTDNDGKERSEFSVAPESEEQRMAKAKFIEGKQTFKLTVMGESIPGNADSSPYFVNLYKDDLVSWSENMTGSNAGVPVVFEVPEGEYVLQMIFRNGNGKYGTPSQVVEKISLNEDMEVSMNAGMATTEISFKCILNDGQEAVLKTSGNSSVEYNTESMYGTCLVNLYGVAQFDDMFSLTNGGTGYTEDRSFRTNLPEDANAYAMCAVTLSSLGYRQSMNIATTKRLEKEDEGNFIVLTNDPGDYNYISPELTRTPAYEEFGDASDPCDVTLMTYYPNQKPGRGFVTTYLVEPEVYACSSEIEEGMGYSLVNLAYFDYVDYDMWYLWGIQTPSFGVTEYGPEYLCLQYNNSYYNKAFSPTTRTSVVNPHFSFPMEEMDLIGESAPVCTVYPKYITISENDRRSIILPDGYYGICGELYDIDVQLAKVKVLADEELIYDGGYSSCYSSMRSWMTGNPIPASMKFEFVNENVVEIDGLEAHNICEVSMNDLINDPVPPSVQRLIFRDSDGRVTNIFKNPDDGMMALCGGDFEEHVENVYVGYDYKDYQYLTYVPASCEVEYAPYGTGEFKSLEIAEDPDKFVPTFGAYWSASLSEVSVESPSHWYDIRVTMTDASGNKQVQTISPAFKIEDIHTDVEKFVEDMEIIVSGNEIIAPDGARIYTAGGILTNGKDINKGVYVVKLGAKTKKVIVM